jgi:hypothetical protein
MDFKPWKCRHMDVDDFHEGDVDNELRFEDSAKLASIRFEKPCLFLFLLLFLWEEFFQLHVSKHIACGTAV